LSLDSFVYSVDQESLELVRTKIVYDVCLPLAWMMFLCAVRISSISSM